MTALTDLADTLRVAPEELGFLHDLDDASFARLDALVSTAVARDSAAIDEGLEKTLAFVPRLLRGRVRKLLMPEGGR